MLRNKISNGWLGIFIKDKVENVLPGMQAAFVDIGYDINAFLPFSEIENSAYLADVDDEDRESSNGRKNKNDQRKTRRKYQDNIDVDLKSGQDIFVQVIKEAFAGKGPRVTTEIALPGRLLVLVPNAKYIGISKKIWDKYERRRLKKNRFFNERKGHGRHCSYCCGRQKVKNY
jgi:RNAse G (EC 3.1.4.-)